MTITAFALFVSALVLHANGQLSLYLGITVSILLYLHAYAAICVLYSDVVVMVGKLSSAGKKRRDEEQSRQDHRDREKEEDELKKKYSSKALEVRKHIYPVLFLASIFSTFLHQQTGLSLTRLTRLTASDKTGRILSDASDASDVSAVRLKWLPLKYWLTHPERPRYVAFSSVDDNSGESKPYQFFFRYLTRHYNSDIGNA